MAPRKKPSPPGTPPPAGPGFRNRVKELRFVRAGDLKPDPRNWRRHPPAQERALRGLLAEVGWADAVLARETRDGLVIVDGHLRAGLDPEQRVPVLLLDLDEEEAGKVLATLDPLGAMAEADPEKIRRLVAEVAGRSGAAVRALLDEIAAKHAPLPPEFRPVAPELEKMLDRRVFLTCPKCGHRGGSDEFQS